MLRFGDHRHAVCNAVEIHPFYDHAMTRLVRDATSADAGVCAEIYAPYVRDTAITFELEPPSEARMAERIETALSGHAWLVLVEDEQVIGYAYGSDYKSRAAYRWACEVSVYLLGDRHRGGGGRALYEALFDRLAGRGFRTVVAGMTLSNEASLGLHAAVGFEPVGTYRRIGWKLDAWHDVAWAQRSLVSLDHEPPAEPT